MFNGRGIYETEEARFAVDDSVFLLLNAGREYAFSIASETVVESLSISFANEWLSDAHAAHSRDCTKLLDDPFTSSQPPEHFFETLYYRDKNLGTLIQQLRRKLDAGAVSEPELEEILRTAAVALLQTQHHFERSTETMDAVKQSTRSELLRRLHRAKDYIHAHIDRDLPLGEIARVAALAPHHFLRSFRAHFGLAPHAYLVEQRLAHARTLLESTDLPIHAICLRVGFSSAPSFSSLFRRRHNLSPRTYRQKNSNSR